MSAWTELLAALGDVEPTSVAHGKTDTVAYLGTCREFELVATRLGVPRSKWQFHDRLQQGLGRSERWVHTSTVAVCHMHWPHSPCDEPEEQDDLFEGAA